MNLLIKGRELCNFENITSSLGSKKGSGQKDMEFTLMPAKVAYAGQPNIADSELWGLRFTSQGNFRVLATTAT